MHHHHDDFDYERIDEMRTKIVDVQKVVDLIHIEKEDVICDMGSGSGFYSALFSKHCKHVYAYEWSEKGNEILEKRIKENHIDNITIKRENICKVSSFPECTKVFFSTSFHDFECRENLIELFKRAGSPDFVLIEFKKEGEVGPPAGIRISKNELEKIFSRHGYSMKKEIEFEYTYVSYFTPVNSH